MDAVIVPLLEGYYIFLHMIMGLNHGIEFAKKFLPFVLLVEVPFYLLVLIGISRYVIRQSVKQPKDLLFYPKVSCVVLCYSEKEGIKSSIISLVEQIYKGHVEVLVIIDGAVQNSETYQAALALQKKYAKVKNRQVIVVPKWKRGGRVSSINAGLSLAKGEVIMVLDGDTSFDNDMVAHASSHFIDKNVVAVSGSLRARNSNSSLITRLQTVEYLISIHTSKVGLSEFNVVNNVSGAFGVFRTSFIRKIYGWDCGTAEDLDLTFRIKQYFGRHPNLRIVFDAKAIGHTDVPDTFLQFFDQRLRWDGDLYWLYVRKHSQGFTPRLLGWANFIGVLWYGIFFQILTPFMIFFYTVYTFYTLPLNYVVGSLLLVYVFYLFVACLFYLVGLLFISERPKQDLAYAIYLPIFPLFMIMVRLWATVATLAEIVLRNNQFSSMAPFWVLNKLKF